jgi:hypothetical protein
MMNRKSCWMIIIFFWATFSISSGGNAASIPPDRLIQVARLNGGQYNALFGYSLALVDNTLAVGDPYDNQSGSESGAVTIYQPDQAGAWKEVTRLIPLDAEAGIHFGRDIAISGDLLVAGAPFDNDFGDRSGSVYIFERNQGGPNAWGQIAKLTASDAYTNDQFGWAVTIDADTVAVGAYTKMYGGRVYVFVRDAGEPGLWGETTQLNPDPPGFQACFGEALDMQGDLLVVGAYGGGDYSGSAYVFQRVPVTGEWQRLVNFRAADTYAYHYFGYSIALDNWTILAGAPGAEGLAGVAYIFTADPAQPESWTERARLTASDGTMGDYFAYALDLFADYAWIGAPLHTEASGAIYLYERNLGGQNHWEEVISLTGDDTSPGDQLGHAISTDGKFAIAGAPGHLPNGSAYIFELNPPWKMSLPVMIR